MMKIKIKYFANDIKRISKFSKGDLIDLRAAETIKFNRGEYKLIPLGVGTVSYTHLTLPTTERV